MFISAIIPKNHLHEQLNGLLDVLMCLRPINEIVIVDSSIERHFPLRHPCVTDPSRRLIHVPVEFALPGAARNLGVTYASNHLIYFLDTRVIPIVSALEANIAKMVIDPSIGGVMGLRTSAAGSEFEIALRDFIVGCRPISSLAGTLVTKTAFYNVGLFNSTVVAGEDREWIVRSFQSSARIEQNSQPNSIYEGFLGVRLEFQAKKWWRYFHHSSDHPIRKNQLAKTILFTLGIGVLMVNPFNRGSDQPTFALAVLAVALFSYLALRLVYLPLTRGVPIERYLSGTYLRNIIIIAFTLDTVRTLAILTDHRGWRALLRPFSRNF